MKNPRPDDWRGVLDPRERKQIQDRLAQRARRRRLREAKEAETKTCDESCYGTTASDASICDWTSSPGELSLMSSLDRLSPSGTSALDQTTPSTKLSVNALGKPPCNPTINTDLLPQIPPTAQPPAPLTVFSAMFINGKILGLTCSTTLPRKSKPQTPDIPLALQPTSTQMLNYHALWIDRFPFQRMRDTMINLSTIIDDEEFLQDLFTMDSFTITPGCSSWDPRSWKLERGVFAEKWGYLLY